MRICLKPFVLLLCLLGLQLTVAVHVQSRHTWTRKSTHGIPRLPGAVPYIIIHHTASVSCSQRAQCLQLLRNIQTDHMRRRFRDIGYNFLITSDGNVYEGVGFGLQGEHAPGYNARSIGIAFVGNYNAMQPPFVMLQRARSLIDYAVRTGRVSRNYKLLGHRQTKSTACPGQRLFNEIKKWPRWSHRP